MRRIFLILMVLYCTVNSVAFAFEFTYNHSCEEPLWYGTGKTEMYDVAVRIDNPTLYGKTITGLKVEVPEGLQDISGWISSDLRLKKRNGKNVNDPDLASQPGVIDDSFLTVSFDSPVIVPQGGCYVGYTFTNSNAYVDPVAVGKGTAPSGLYMHTSRTKLKWGSISETTDRVSSMTISFAEDIPPYSAVFKSPLALGVIEEPIDVNCVIVNCGYEAIDNIEYSWTAGKYSGSGLVSVDVPGYFGAEKKVKLNITPIVDSGEYALGLRVVKVNGKSVNDPEVEGKLTMYPFLPVNRPLVEEYTGLWCGWCPRGYVALERMRELYGDQFIAAAYHDGDPMAFSFDTPNRPSGYPAAFVNRSFAVDLACIDSEWETYRQNIPLGDLEISVDWGDSSNNSIKVNAETRFVRNFEGADYRLCYLLIADGLDNPKWKQHNSFSGGSAEEYPYMDNHFGRIFLDGDDYVQGLTFNDVAVLSSNIEGIRGSVPSNIVAGMKYTHSWTFDITDLDHSVYDNSDKFRVIAILIDGKTGKFINCNSSSHLDGTPFTDSATGLVTDSFSDSGEMTEVMRYAIDGRLLKKPSKGINIITVR